MWRHWYLRAATPHERDRSTRRSRRARSAMAHPGHRAAETGCAHPRQRDRARRETPSVDRRRLPVSADPPSRHLRIPKLAARPLQRVVDRPDADMKRLGNFMMRVIRGGQCQRATLERRERPATASHEAQLLARDHFCHRIIVGRADELHRHRRSTRLLAGDRTRPWGLGALRVLVQRVNRRCKSKQEVLACPCRLNDGSRLTGRAHPGEAAERHPAGGLPPRRCVKDGHPRLLRQVLWLGAGDEVAGSDGAHHRLVQLEQPVLGCAIPCPGGGDESSFEARRGERLGAGVTCHAFRP
ncbi:hypothetical protein C8N24_0627 [Solirubrobacter pauli]|uniref:Uncharacterized protein n=1 Tax=Solirubrobacter pauli TaxID=166793 RepID=A0A660L725_9ACTN|nr:hypothetical protein C8N24_0627 [Solirubrobacter pauli]